MESPRNSHGLGWLRDIVSVERRVSECNKGIQCCGMHFKNLSRLFEVDIAAFSNGHFLGKLKLKLARV